MQAYQWIEIQQAVIQQPWYIIDMPIPARSSVRRTLAGTEEGSIWKPSFGPSASQSSVLGMLEFYTFLCT
jgi:hypothetical protein